MFRFLRCALLILTSLPGLRAQDGGSTPAAATPSLRVSLTATSGVLRLGRPLSLSLRIDADQDVEVPASALGGIDLDVSIDGRALTPIQEGATGKVRIAAGTSVVRAIELDPEQRWTAGDLRDAHQIALTWKGIDGARVIARVVPDQHDLDVGALDLEKTKVHLITSDGEIVIGFFPDKAPRHAVNFITLAKDGFYDGTRFHRILAGFMAQGGCPNTKLGATGVPGTGGSGRTVRAEFNDIKHVRGIVSMARSASEDSASSQFFLMHGAAPHLDGKYSAFGAIEAQSLPVLDQICNTRVAPSPQTGEPSVPQENVWLFAAVVEPVFKG